MNGLALATERYAWSGSIWHILPASYANVDTDDDAFIFVV